jgi:hypothetical protein
MARYREWTGRSTNVHLLSGIFRKSEEEVQICFPVDSEFARPSEGGNSDPSRWVLDYGFIARDEKATYHVNFVRRAKNKNPEEFGSVFVWKMKFAPKEIRTLTVQYHIPMSMGLVGTDKDDGSASSAGRALSQELMHIAYLDMAGYITSTGSSWAGNVETATFTVITGPFEQYLGRRGITEETQIDMTTEKAEQFDSSFPVRHAWWFRHIKPSGWKEVKQGLRWTYKDFKPKEPIEIAYYMTQLPQVPDEVDPFLNRFLEGLEPGESPDH